MANSEVSSTAALIPYCDILLLSPRTTRRFLSGPAQTPGIAFQIAYVLSLLGCVVSEFIASSKGLGFVIKARSQDLDVSTMFAAIIILSAIGVIGTMLIRSVQRRVVFWAV